uniref:Sentrin-specific protease 6-like n=1 Tax=Ciona intestinalis TaxID=7719 RepID=F7A2J2_CIOIN
MNKQDVRTYRVTRSAILKHPGTPSSSIDITMHFTGPRIERAIYPPPPEKGGITITNEDEFCLNSGEFLNDVIIDFYLKYIMRELLSEEDRGRSHAFSCFFYKQLTQIPSVRNKPQVEDKVLTPSQKRHRKVQKWTRSVDIFEKDFIFFPINEASHWYLAVICFPRQQEHSLNLNILYKEITYAIDSTLETDQNNQTDKNEPTPSNHCEPEQPVANSNPSTEKTVAETNSEDMFAETDSDCNDNGDQYNCVSEQQVHGHRQEYRAPCILIFDSLRGPSRSKVAAHLRDYLNVEWSTRKEAELGPRVFNKNTIKMCTPHVPQQDNYSDCGIFLLQYVEQIFKNPIKNFNVPIKNLVEWFDPTDCQKKREEIRTVIRELCIKQGNDPDKQ